MNENRQPPTPKTYSDYIKHGREAKRTGKTVNGVKGIWILDELPYASHIHWTKDAMHTFDNIIKDSIKVFKRSEKTYENRTMSTKVMSACQEERIFSSAYGPNYNEAPPWVLNGKNAELHDLKLDNVSGAYLTEIPSNVMKYGKVGNSHDTIKYAINGWAAWCLFNEHGEAAHTFPFTEIKIKLFDIIGKLSCGRILKDSLPTLETELINVLIEHCSLFPPCEATYTLHELVHIVKQIYEIGPPRYSTLFKFERVNLFLKRMIKNKNVSLPSMVKNYLVIFCFLMLYLYI